VIYEISMTSVDTELGQTISSAVAMRLRNDIRTAVLAPGSRLRQSQIAKQYNVSTTPVREAFMMLEREGLLTRHDHRGVVVFHPTVADLREIYLIRIPLEALAAEQGVPHLTDADIARMTQILREIKKVYRDGDNRELASKLNDEFHSIIYRAADLPRLTTLISRLRSASAVYIKLYRVFDPTADTERDHAAILEACKARAPKRAAAAMTKHLKHTLDVVADGLARQST
jgi:DNA-binding GntR family transcriptional regulator